MLGLAEVVYQNMGQNGDQGGGHMGGVDDGRNADPPRFCCTCRQKFGMAELKQLKCWYIT